jgi:hypothetical protein
MLLKLFLLNRYFRKYKYAAPGRIKRVVMWLENPSARKKANHNQGFLNLKSDASPSYKNAFTSEKIKRQKRKT